MFTVGEGLAKEYEKHFGVRPTIITNATRFHDIRPSEVPQNRVRLIHHGIVNESRKLELMIELMKYLDERFELDLILMTSNYASQKTRSYIQFLKDQIEKTPRMRVLPAVKSHEVVGTINSYDMGVFLIPPINFNYANTLPNKLFDFVQARLGILISPAEETSAIIARYGLGPALPDHSVDGLIAALSTLTDEKVQSFKQHSHEAAHDLSSASDEAAMRALVARVT